MNIDDPCPGNPGTATTVFFFIIYSVPVHHNKHSLAFNSSPLGGVDISGKALSDIYNNLVQRITRPGCQQSTIAIVAGVAGRDI